MSKQDAFAKNGHEVKSLIKALRILDALGESPGGLGVTKLSQAFQAPKSTVHRLLTTLKSEGYVVFDPNTSRYLLGTRVAKLGEQLFQQSPVLTFGVATLEHLTRNYRETSLLAVLEGTDVVYSISREERKDPLRISFGMGYRAPAHCTALGKACLSGQSEAEILKLYKNRKQLGRFTPRTVINVKKLLSELSVVRKDGLAYDNEEYIPTVRCLAVPIRDFSSRVVGSIGLSTPKHRMTAARKAQFTKALLDASAELSEKLGFLPGLNPSALRLLTRNAPAL